MMSFFKVNVHSIIITLIFSILTLSLILSGNGIPYVLDGNETYSSLWHAYSMHQFGFEASKGLADEVFSPNFLAHPYVHSHQGNFPRLYAWILYELGARSAEAQILITAFSIGLVTVLIGYKLFAKVVNPNFSLILISVLMTDYILFAQWQVVTYRVWSGFFFFAELLAVFLYADTSKKFWLWTLYFLSVFLLYSELIFAAFVGITSFFWLIALSWENKRKILTASVVMLLGALTGLLIFFCQSIWYLGWDNFLTDIYLTYGSRNDYSALTASIISQISSFYSDNHVIFWENFQDIEQNIRLSQFVRSLTSFDWQVHTPFFSGLVLPPILAATICIMPMRKRRSYIQLFSKSFIVENLFLSFMYIVLSILGLCLLTFWTQHSNLEFAHVITNSEKFVYVTFSVLFSLLFISFCNDISPRRLVLFFTILLIYAFLMPNLYDFRFELLWFELHQVNNVVIGSIIFFLVIFSSMEWMTLSSISEPEILKLRNLLSLIAIFFAGYACIYFLSSGYIQSGYLNRSAPFTVFISDTIIALAFYILYRVLAINTAKLNWKSSYLLIFKVTLSSLALVLLIGIWIQIQYSYVKLIPPIHYSFLKKLAAPPYRGKSFVSNNYAAPIAAYTFQWAYMDPNLGNGYLIGKNLIGDKKYLWFADKKTNQSYRRPDYYLCMIPQSLTTAFYTVLFNRGLASRQNGCLDQKLVKMALDKNKGLSLVEYDTQGTRVSGFVSWAIVKFDWDSSSNIGEGIVWRQELKDEVLSK